jgi:hypothetical protein
MKFNKCRGVDDLKAWIALNSHSPMATQSLCEQFEEILIHFGEAYPGQPVTMRLGEYPDAPDGAFNAMKLIINTDDVKVEEIIAFKFDNEGKVREVLRYSQPGAASTSGVTVQ